MLLSKGVAEHGKETNTCLFFFQSPTWPPPQPPTFLIEYVFSIHVFWNVFNNSLHKKFRTWENIWWITHTQPVLQSHLTTWVPSSFLSAVIPMPHSHPHQSGTSPGPVQKFISQCCCPQAHIRWFPSLSAALDCWSLLANHHRWRDGSVLHFRERERRQLSSGDQVRQVRPEGLKWSWARLWLSWKWVSRLYMQTAGDFGGESRGTFMHGNFLEDVAAIEYLNKIRFTLLKASYQCYTLATCFFSTCFWGSMCIQVAHPAGSTIMHICTTFIAMKPALKSKLVLISVTSISICDMSW